MSPQEMDKSLLGIASDIEPTAGQATKKEKFSFNPLSGEKIRHDKKLPRKMTKKESKRDRRLKK